MKRLSLVIMISGLFGNMMIAAEPDIVVTQDGESLKVYNLDITTSAIYYTETENTEAPVKKLSRADVLIIKTAEGKRIDPNLDSAIQNQSLSSKPSVVVNPDEHPAVTYEAMSDFVKDKKGVQTLLVRDENGSVVRMRLVPEEDKTLAVTTHGKDLKYKESSYIFPEYVTVNGEVYTVKYIDEKAFKDSDSKIKSIQFPLTLKEIGDRAFCGRWGLHRIVLPESLEKIGDEAFYLAGFSSKTFEQLYIPKGVKYIGRDAFRFVGPNTSPRGFFQGNLSSAPSFVTTGNCTTFGIDEEAVETYERRTLNK